MTQRLTGLAAALACAAAALPSPASAAFAPGALPASSLGSDLGDRTSGSALISGDGRYVVFRTGAAALLGAAPAGQYYSDGWVRKDLVTGAVDLVATPERRRREDGALVEPSVADDAAGVSDDGRYVLIVSRSARCCGVTSNVTPEVYVRDMTQPRAEAAAYELVSSQDGTVAPPVYGDVLAGSASASRGFSLSDDGRTALFVTQTTSSLPDAAVPETPRWQVFVRDLDRQTTRLVTRALDDPTLPGTPVRFDGANVQQPAAALSGDGGAVAWTSVRAEEQARFLPGEDASSTMTQLLWRDLRAGPATPARRVAGQADPEDPACPPDAAFVADDYAAGPCYGPFARPDDQTLSEPIPPRLAGLSDDGRRVLFVSSSLLRPFTGVLRRGSGYLADMSPGVTRKQGVTVAWSQPDTRLPITSGALAGDGRHAAFVSVGNEFDGFQPVGTFQGDPLETPNVFAADLGVHTVERATVASDGRDYLGPSEVRDLSVSDDGSAIAFSAPDGNLFVGDANGVFDVQVVRRATGGGDEQQRRRELPPPPAPPAGSEPPLHPLQPAHAVIGRVRVDARGVASVLVRVPAAGTLTAEATGRATRTRRSRASRSMRVGRDRRAPRRASRVMLRIRPSAAVRRLLRRAPHRVDVALRIRFETSGGSSRSDQRYTIRASPRPKRRSAPRRGGRR